MRTATPEAGDVLKYFYDNGRGGEVGYARVIRVTPHCLILEFDRTIDRLYRMTKARARHFFDLGKASGTEVTPWTSNGSAEALPPQWMEPGVYWDGPHMRVLMTASCGCEVRTVGGVPLSCSGRHCQRHTFADLVSGEAILRLQ